MSKTEWINNQKTESKITSQSLDKINLNKKQNFQNLEIKIQQSNDESININKTEESLLNEKNSSENIYNKSKRQQIKKIENDINNINNNANNNKILEETNNNKNNNENNNKDNKKKKEVKFLEPQFVEVIYVESYKKYNEENTSKDPYFGNDNNKDENKTKLMCSCLIS